MRYRLLEEVVLIASQYNAYLARSLGMNDNYTRHDFIDEYESRGYLAGGLRGQLLPMLLL